MPDHKTIVCISSIDWDFFWQRHQILMSKFALQKDTKIFFVENFSHTLVWGTSFCIKAIHRLKRIFLKNTPRYNPCPDNITIITPFVIPSQSRLAVFLNKAIFIKSLARQLKKNAQNPMVWTYRATSLAQELIDALKPECIIYDAVSDVRNHPHSPPDIVSSEQKLINKADIIFTDNRELLLRCRQTNPHTYFIPAGVNAEEFAPPLTAPHKDMLSGIGRPRICYFGAVEEIKFDSKLLISLAESKPNWNFVILGKVIRIDSSPLKEPNIFLKGPLSHEELPGYLQAMDVLIIPYKINSFSKSIFPAKIFECLATGKPVVATPLEELKHFPQGLIHLAGTQETFIEAIESSLTADTTEMKNTRIEYARNNSWETRFKDIETIIAKRYKQG
jgi:glycosyltransferase involved in cell wall biosynthesis